MLNTYRAAFDEPGTASFCAAGFVMRLPIAIYPLGLVLIVSARTGHYGFAGFLAGVYVIGNGAGNPVLARLVDRYGQSRLLLPTSALHVSATAVLGVVIETHAPQWTYLAPAFVSGFAYLAVGSLVRARWTFVLGGRPEMSTAYSLESILDELIFTLGPLLATLIATTLDPVLVLVLTVGLVFGGAVWLRSLRATEPPAQAVGADRHRSALRQRGMLLLTLTAVAMGSIFASAEVTMVAFCGQHGHRGLSGLVLACFAIGSGTSGFLYGARRWHASVLTRFRLHALVFGALPLLFLAATNIPVLAVCSFVVGLGIAPTLITAFGLIESIVPAGALTEGLAWLTTGLSVGYGGGSALVGGIADAHGARIAFLVTVGSGLVMAVLAVALHGRLAPSRQPVGSGRAAPNR
ncbi:MAG: MFS transporter [Jatrophihabitantaceae bacterium]